MLRVAPGELSRARTRGTYAETMPRERRNTANNMMAVGTFQNPDQVRGISCQEGDAADNSGP